MSMLQLRAKRGFTLIELLVVIAVIAMLVSILLPSLQQAKEMAKAMKCTTNLNAIAKAARLYATDNNGFLPRDYYYNANDRGNGNFMHYFFASRLAEFAGGSRIPAYYDDPENGDPGGLEQMSFDEAQEHMAEIFEGMDVYHCPSLSTEIHKLHYVSNGVDFERFARTQKENGQGSWYSSPASQLEKMPFSPSSAIYIAEANLDELDADWYGKHDMFKTGHYPFDTDGEMNWGPRMIRADDTRHFGKTTVVFFDGHAETRELSEEELGLEHFNPLWSK